jgi:hypothetical protein
LVKGSSESELTTLKQKPTQLIPTHRVLIDRRTRKEVGPRVAINPRDWPYKILPNEEILWRYMDFWKIEHMLKTSTLFFARQDLLEDPFEGRFSEGNVNQFSVSDTALHEAYQFKRSFAEAKEQHELHRRCVFVSCWHRNTREDPQMWRAYTSGIESVVVTTSAKALYSLLPAEVMKSPVMYHRSDFARSEYSWDTLSFYKPAAYSFEREFRMLRSLGESESVCFNKPSDCGRSVPVVLKKVIHRLITHPNAGRTFKEKLDAMVAKYLPRIVRQDSVIEI